MIRKLLGVLGVCIALTVLQSIYIEPNEIASSITEASENTPKEPKSWVMQGSIDQMTGEQNRFTGVWTDTKLKGTSGSSSVYIGYNDSDHGSYVGGDPVFRSDVTLLDKGRRWIIR